MREEWLRCRPWIEAALSYARGTHLIEDVEAGIEAGLYHFWSTPNSAAVTEIIVYPRLKALNYWLIGGDLEELKTLLEPAVTNVFAKQQGCTRVIGIGRKGFERAFRANGFEPAWLAISKEI